MSHTNVAKKWSPPFLLAQLLGRFLEPEHHRLCKHCELARNLRNIRVGHRVEKCRGTGRSAELGLKADRTPKRVAQLCRNDDLCRLTRNRESGCFGARNTRDRCESADELIAIGWTSLLHEASPLRHFGGETAAVLVLRKDYL